ncbi:MAG: 30S ribosomal protein S3 [Patescibacteria group bacterium]
MGQKTHPLGFRLGVSQEWKSRWFARGQEYGRTALADVYIRRYLEENAASSGIADLEIEREAEKIKVILKVSRPGVVIGRGGSTLNILKAGLNKLLDRKIDLVVEEVKVPELSGKLVGEDVVRQIKMRMPIRRVMNNTAEKVMSRGAKGVKIICSGVLSGPSSISRREKVVKGSVPSQTLRANINYARSTVFTSYGTIGVKVWVYLGEVEGK